VRQFLFVWAAVSVFLSCRRGVLVLHAEGLHSLVCKQAPGQPDVETPRHQRCHRSSSHFSRSPSHQGASRPDETGWQTTRRVVIDSLAGRKTTDMGRDCRQHAGRLTSADCIPQRMNPPGDTVTLAASWKESRYSHQLSLALSTTVMSSSQLHWKPWQQWSPPPWIVFRPWVDVLTDTSGDPRESIVPIRATVSYCRRQKN